MSPGLPAHLVGEWFGQRIFPVVQFDADSLPTMRAGDCPFLSEALQVSTECIKAENSKGVCTITSRNGKNYGRTGTIDWLVCPYRTLDHGLLDEAVRRLYEVKPGEPVAVLAAVTLEQPELRERVRLALMDGERVFVYFRSKLGGEISISPTAKSPELSFDIAVVELEAGDQGPHIGRFAIVEIQTMEFHGTYTHATSALRNALDLHGDRFGEQVSINPEWAGRRIQGPSVADTFKRTFYQMIFKFQLGAHERCAGTVLALPSAVWNTWRPHLGGAPIEQDKRDPVLWTLPKPKGVSLTETADAWIVVFDIDTDTGQVPNPLRIDAVVKTDTPTLLHYAFDVAPEAAFGGGAIDTVYGKVCTKVLAWWPELAATLT